MNPLMPSYSRLELVLSKGAGAGFGVKLGTTPAQPPVKRPPTKKKPTKRIVNERRLAVGTVITKVRAFFPSIHSPTHRRR